MNLEMKVKNLWVSYQNALDTLGREFETRWENHRDADDLLKINAWHRQEKKRIENQFIQAIKKVRV